MSTIKMRPCPFCGRPPLMVADKGGSIGIFCENCDLLFGFFVYGWSSALKDPESAAELWNDVDCLPSAEPERKHGRWINDNGLYRCTSCNQLWTEWWAASKPIERMKKEVPYCPMCGSYNGEGSGISEESLRHSYGGSSRKKGQ